MTDLFEHAAARAEQQDHKARVSSKIGKAIIAFFRERGIGAQFHADDLVSFIMLVEGNKIAPDSPGRIMRDLRRSGHINYRVVSRRQSLYEVTT